MRKTAKPLPDGWEKATLGELVEPSKCRIMPSDAPELRYVGLEHIESQTMKLLGHRQAGEARSSSLAFLQGDVLYGKMRPYLNKVWVAEFDGLCSAEFLVFPKTVAIDSKFLALRLNAPDFVEFANSKVSGERPRVGFETLRKFKIMLPPVAEQRRIVLKLESSLSRVAAGVSALERAHGRLNKYRIRVCEAAASGELTLLWRQEHLPSESGPELLDLILQERYMRWETTKPENNRSKHGAQLKSEDMNPRYPQPVPPQKPEATLIPEGWTWASISQLSWNAGYGTSVKCIPDGSGPPVLRIPNIHNREIHLADLKYASSEETLGKNSIVAPGDFLIIRTNGSKELIGRAALVLEPLPGRFGFASYLVRYRLLSEQTMWRWVNIAWDSPQLRQQIETKAQTTAGQYNVSLTRLANTSIPLPPLVEQDEILRIVDQRLTAANKLETKLHKSRTRANEQRQLLLLNAFAGNFVRQDSNDEPASDLLSRARRPDENEDQIRKERILGSRESPTGTSGESLLDVINDRFGAKAFTFDDLRKEFAAADYERIQAELFELARANPNESTVSQRLNMSFNSDSGIIEFRVHKR